MTTFAELTEQTLERARKEYVDWLMRHPKMREDTRAGNTERVHISGNTKDRESVYGGSIEEYLSGVRGIPRAPSPPRRREGSSGRDVREEGESITLSYRHSGPVPAKLELVLPLETWSKPEDRSRICRLLENLWVELVVPRVSKSVQLLREHQGREAPAVSGEARGDLPHPLEWVWNIRRPRELPVDRGFGGRPQSIDNYDEEDNR